MNEPLAPCPYCFGCKPTLSNNLFSFQVTCTTCLATGPTKTSHQDAISAWNELSTEVNQARKKETDEFVSRLREFEQTMLLYR
ncbi:MAG: hypothetical protein P8X74_12315 [Reinekea sp.]|jgi:hypothetical protein